MEKRIKTTKVTRSILALVLAFVMVFTSLVAVPVNPMVTVHAATTIITGGEGNLSGTLSTDETYKVEVEDCCLKATVGTSTYKFRNYLNIVGIATVADDDLLHIFTLSGKYYVVDLRHGSFVTIEVWRNSSTWKYAAKGTDSYEVFGSSVIDTKYFYERISVNSVTRERLVNRSEFEAITNPGGSGSSDPESNDPTPAAKNKYVVGFNTNGGSYIASQTVEEGSKVTRPSDPTKSGYTFAGWYTDSALTSPFDFNTPITAETTLYAKWTENAKPGNDQPATTEKYMVSFNTNGGSYIASQTVEKGAKASRPTDPTKSENTFAGWYADSALTSPFDFNTPINAETTIYAKWTANNANKPGKEQTNPVATKYMVDFNTYGGSYVASQIVDAGSKVLRPTDPTKSGYTFAGWYADSALTSPFDFNTAINANTTVYAKWTANTKPSNEQPSTEAPTTEQPKTETPSTDKPSTEIDPNKPSETDINGTMDINWWYQRYVDGLITWDQLMQILYQYNWTAKANSTSTSTTYYFYDETGKLVKEVTESTGTETANGSGNGSAIVKDDGSADVRIVDKGEGQAEVKVTVEAATTPSGADVAAANAAAEAAKAATEAAKTISNNNASIAVKASTSKQETYYHVKRKGKKVKLECRRAKKTGTVCTVHFDKKKKIAKYDGITYKNIKYVGYTQGSRMILMITTGNKVYIVPRVKGQIGNIYTKRVLKGKWKLAIEDNAGLVIRVSDKKKNVKGVRNATPVKIKTDKY